MFVHRVAPILALLLALSAEPAWAFFDPPYIAPAQPAAGQPVSLNIYGGVCDAIVGLPGYPQITQQGNSIRILLFGVHYGDPEFCNLGAGTATIPIGSYPPGAYILQVDFRYMDAGGSFVVDTLGIVPFNVTSTAAAPTAVPMLDIAGAIILVTTLAGIASRRLRSKRSRRWRTF